MAMKIFREAKSAENTNSCGSISLSADPISLTSKPGWFVSSGIFLGCTISQLVS